MGVDQVVHVKMNPLVDAIHSPCVLNAVEKKLFTLVQAILHESPIWLKSTRKTFNGKRAFAPLEINIALSGIH